MMVDLAVFVGGFFSGVITLVVVCACASSKEEEDRAYMGEMRADLDVYADTLCEYGTSNEGCGRYPDDVCFGCRARKHIWQHKPT